MPDFITTAPCLRLKSLDCSGTALPRSFFGPQGAAREQVPGTHKVCDCFSLYDLKRRREQPKKITHRASLKGVI
jgi:hypothetical protein